MSSEESQTRVKVLKVTVEELEKQRGKGVRMADIAKQAGVSRQAVYLHFASRTELLEAATRFLDERLALQERLAPYRAANTGEDKLKAYISFWGHYIPEIYGVAKALLLMRESDKAADAAWKDRMAAMREGCVTVVNVLHHEGKLASEWTKNGAIDVLWTLLSVENWEKLTNECGWSNQQYVKRTILSAKRLLIEK